MRLLTLAKQTEIIGGLVEGNSIRSMERMTGAHRDSIMRLALRVGAGCAKIMDEEMRDLTCEKLQADEIWQFVGSKQKNVRPEHNPQERGDFWTFVAIDQDTKLVPSFLVGKRDRATTVAFCADLASRLTNRCQLSTDAFPAYVDAIEKAFGADVDYGQVVKFYDSTHGTGRYSPPVCIGAKRTPIAGGPVHEHISTSIIDASKLDDENANAPFHAADQRLFQKGRRLTRGGGAAFRALQFRARASNTARHARDGSGCQQARLGARRIG